MLYLIRRSQIVGLMTIEKEANAFLDRVKEVWSDPTGRVAYLGCTKGYARLQQVLEIEPNAIYTGDRWRSVEIPSHLRCLYRLDVYSWRRESLGWVKDFIFDWQTGEIKAYILAGKITGRFNRRVVLLPEDVKVMEANAIVIKEGAQKRIKSASEGLKGFLCEKSPRIQKLVKYMSDRLYPHISPDDNSDVIRFKINLFANELVLEGKYNKHDLLKATEFVQQYWKDIAYSLNRSKEVAQSSLEAAWKQIISN
ncbi:MAG: PRC-barrel domain-containing protein [Hydrococcus sp. Prado102]|jgi:sporulation protein YlmC with PRC-barrel domain|nr:PRC-barrel domain-containing protein [Hydrococcus sp. Prado102]